MASKAIAVVPAELYCRDGTLAGESIDVGLWYLPAVGELVGGKELVAHAAWSTGSGAGTSMPPARRASRTSSSTSAGNRATHVPVRPASRASVLTSASYLLHVARLATS